MPLYRNYEHCREVVLSLLPRLPVYWKNKMRVALAASKCFEEKEATYYLNSKLYEQLFDIEDALNEGFAQFIENQIKELDRFNAYHRKNCTGEGCELCQTTLIT